VLLPVLNGRRDTRDFGYYRAIKRLECAMKVTESVFERRINLKKKLIMCNLDSD